MDACSKLKRVETDRFTDLPDCIAHHIISFLTNIEDIAGLCLTSKKCKDLCLSSHSLVIDAARFSTRLADSAKRIQFMDFLVSLIRQSADLTNLAIWWSDVNLTSDEMCRIMWMLNGAIECHISKLDLSLRLESGVFVVPLDLFYMESLRSLKLNLKMGMLELPCTYGFSHIETLHLNQVKTSDEDIGEWISSFFKFLKELHVKQLLGIKKLKITSSSLGRFEIKYCVLHHLYISAQSLRDIVIMKPFSLSVRASLNIYAPNALRLALHALSSNDYSLGKMDLLKVVSPSLSPGFGRNNSNSLLRSIAQTRGLLLSCEHIKIMYDDGCLPFIFNNLKTLKLYHFGLDDALVPSLAMFFQSLQLGLKTLRIRGLYNPGTNSSSSRTCQYGLQFWESQNLLFLEGLKEIEMDLVGGKNEEGLLEYILNNATNLKWVVISCGSYLQSQIANKLITAALASGSNFQYKGAKILHNDPICK